MNAQQLKNSILQMAVQGKLVPQDPNDEPASVLLERIRAEKEKLIKEGKIKKEKNPSNIFRGEDNLPYEKVGKKEPVCIADDIPFEIPDTWEWARLLSVCEEIGDIDHNMPKATSEQTGIPFLSAKDINDDNSLNFSHNVKYISLDDYIRLGRKMTPRLGDIVFSRIGSLGKVGVVRDNTKFLISYSCCIIRPASINLEYLKYYLMSPIIQAHILDAKTGIGVPDLGMGEIKTCYIPIPPLNEQKRIVERLDELIPYIIRYDEKETALSALIRVFPELLKKSILQHAVMGKLVPQDPNDEPASVLLEKIRAEKDALIKTGKLKKDKHESIIYRRDNSHYEKDGGKEDCINDEIPFDIPESWTWCRLAELASFIGGYAYKSTEFVRNSDYQVLRLGNVKNDCLKLEQKPVYISEQQALLTKNFLCQRDDILLTMTGTRGKRDYFFTTKITSEKNLYINQRVGCLRAYNSYLSAWLIYVLKSECVLSQVFAHETGTANQGNLGAENIMSTLIPLPPFNEQLRIIKSLEQCLIHITSL